IALTSTRFLDCAAEVAIAHLLLEQGLIAMAKLDDGTCDAAERNFYQGKVETVRYYCRNFLPQVFGRARIIRMEDTTATQIPESCL
ncbi:MAG: acyl-CoA dehydrogenase C-terminal domain-containing protein, partial [Syntrophales bacterium]|nr:acyl-CoA dehydrogenase C-terminal domain-containing protein [Syntrophales bacterium]